MAVCVMASVFMWRSCPLDGMASVFMWRSHDGCLCDGICFMWRSCPLDGCLCDGICIHVEVLSIRRLFV